MRFGVHRSNWLSLNDDDDVDELPPDAIGLTTAAWWLVSTTFITSAIRLDGQLLLPVMDDELFEWWLPTLIRSFVSDEEWCEKRWCLALGESNLCLDIVWKKEI